MHPAISRRSLVNHVGIAVLLVGMSLGCLLYWRSLQSDPGAGDDDALALQEQSRAYELSVEKNVGKLGLLMSQWSDAIGKLGEPGPLAITIMVVSNLVAGGCFLVAARLPAAKPGQKVV